MRHVSLFIFLGLFWTGLSWQTSPNLVALGILCCLGVTLFSHRMGLIDKEGHPIESFKEIPGYIVWLYWEMLKANVDVVRRVWDPQLPIEPHLFRLEYRTKTGFATAVYANSITVTPGTVTVSVDERTLLIHALSNESAQGLKDGVMHRKCLRLEGTSECS
ncbi:MAG TPA: cation transporter [Verrucomicrobiales bacterium]|nr:cation transporter [Verrucomicrobiales bacterium]